MFESTVVCGRIALGIQGEHHARRVSFAETELWKERFGEGSFELLHQRNGDESPYPIALTIEDDVPYWYVTNADTAVAGVGMCELRYIVDHVVIKSCTFITDVIESLGDDLAEPPEPQKAWVDQVLEAADKVENATANPPIIGDNGNWFVFDVNVGEYIDSGVSASGEALTPEQIELINSVPDKADKDSVPTKVSDLHNDDGFVTQEYVDGLVGDIEAALDEIIAIENNYIMGVMSVNEGGES